MRDTVKTIIGLAVIAIIVVATFFYGSAQRKAQLKHDQQVQQQQLATGQSTAKSPTPTVKPSAPAGKNTAPVNTPKSNAIQGGSSAGKTPASVPATPAAVPTTGGTSQPLPQTGSPLGGLVGVAAIIGVIFALRQSQRALLSASRSQR